MSRLVDVAITPMERSLGLLVHLRRADAPPEKPRAARICAKCGVEFVPHRGRNAKTAKHCTDCYWRKQNRGAKHFGDE